MHIPTYFIPITTKAPKVAKRGEVTLEKADSNPDIAKQTANSHVIMYDKRENKDRRQRQVKTLLDTRSGRDRRYDKNNPPIDIKA
jgi:hypothetical protein